MKKNNLKYKITSADNHNVCISLIMLAVFGGVSIWLHLSENRAYVFVDILTAVVLIITIYTLYCRIFKKLLIDGEGFYLQTAPGNGRYFKFSEAKEAWIGSNSAYGFVPSGFCFNFRTAAGEEYRFTFKNNQSDGIDYLTDIINGANADT